jgi:membrane-associated phospholipid phosphatase
MWPVIVDLVAAVVAGGAVVLLVRRWPHTPVAAPKVSTTTIRTEVRRHDRVAQMLRARVDPETTTGLVLTLAAAIVIVGGVGVGVLLLMVRRSLGFAKWDLSAARFGAQHATSASTAVLKDISLFGGTLGLIVVVLVTLVVEQRRIPSRAAIGFLLLVVVGQNLLANGIKALVDRARPDLSQLTGFAGSSFPSGHSTAAAATYAGIALLLSRRRSPGARALLAGGAVAIAVAVAASRVLLGVHWLTDVMAGLALGWAWFAACSIAFGGRLMRFGAPVVAAEQAADAGTNAATVPTASALPSSARDHRP